MSMKRRRVALPTVVVMALSAGFALADAARPTVPTARAATCAASDTGIVKKTPTETSLPGGASLRVWHDSRMTLSQVAVPASATVGLHLWTSGALTRSVQPTTVLKHHSKGVAIMNADVFDAARGSLPQGIEVVHRRVAKAEHTAHNAVFLGAGHQIGQGLVQLVGHVRAGGKSAALTSLNWQSIYGWGVSVYTKPWGGGSIPHGSVDVVVASGMVKAIRHGNLGRAPSSGQQILTGTGDAATFLDHLRVGQKVAVSFHPKYAFHYGETAFPVIDAVNHDTPYWLEGKRWPVECNSRNMTHWSRTAVGYDQHGNAFLLAASGPDRYHYGGGATAFEMQYYLRALGAHNADGFDSDTSVTLAVRHKLGGAVFRVDKANSFYERPVPNYFGVQ